MASRGGRRMDCPLTKSSPAMTTAPTPLRTMLTVIGSVPRE